MEEKLKFSTKRTRTKDRELIRYVWEQMHSLERKHEELYKNGAIDTQRKSLDFNIIKVHEVVEYFVGLRNWEYKSSPRKIRGVYSDMVKVMNGDENASVLLATMDVISSVDKEIFTTSKKAFQEARAKSLDSRKTVALLGSSYHLYYVKEESGGMCIAKCWIHIKSNDKVTLVSSNKQYDGEITEYSPIMIRLHTGYAFKSRMEIFSQTEVKFLFIHYREGHEAMYIEGYLISYLSDGTLRQNSVLLKKAEEIQDSFTPVKPDECASIQYYTSTWDNLDRNIREYFSNYALSRSATARANLSNRNDIKKINGQRQILDRPYKYDIFISCPVSLIDGDMYEKLQAINEGIINLCNEKFGIPYDRIHTPGTHRFDTETTVLIPFVEKSFGQSRDFHGVKENLMASRNYLLLLPNVKTSFALMQAFMVAGDGHGDNKKFVFVIDDKNELPAILSDKHTTKDNRVLGRIIKVDFSKDAQYILSFLKGEPSVFSSLYEWELRSPAITD